MTKACAGRLNSYRWSPHQEHMQSTEVQRESKIREQAPPMFVLPPPAMRRIKPKPQNSSLAGMDLPAEPEARERVELLGQTQGALQKLNCTSFRGTYLLLAVQVSAWLLTAGSWPSARRLLVSFYISKACQPRKAMSTKVIPDLSAALTLEAWIQVLPPCF